MSKTKSPKSTNKSTKSKPKVPGSHVCYHCKATGTPNKDDGVQMRHISEVVTPTGHQVGVCVPCRDAPTCAVCHAHPQEMGKLIKVGERMMCGECAPIARAIQGHGLTAPALVAVA